jgi:NAD(P)-dependent dehydrogenase (short-subunit alcohol dehydrogenase family)
MRNGFEDAQVLVTGASAHRRAAARHLASWARRSCSRRAAQADRAIAEEIRSAGGRASAVICDVAIMRYGVRPSATGSTFSSTCRDLSSRLRGLERERSEAWDR